MEMRRIIALAISLAALSAATIAETPQEAFTRSWVGKTVFLKQPLFTLSYDERGTLGQTRRDKRDGLNVVTPFKGSYLQFDGRQGQEEVTESDPLRLFDKVNVLYQPNNLSFRSYRKVQPHLIYRYDPGPPLTVSGARVERDFVRIVLFDPKTDFGEEPATALTVRWPVPFSRAFSERTAVEGLMQQYLKFEPGS